MVYLLLLIACATPADSGLGVAHTWDAVVTVYTGDCIDADPFAPAAPVPGPGVVASVFTQAPGVTTWHPGTVAIVAGEEASVNCDGLPPETLWSMTIIE